MHTDPMKLAQIIWDKLPESEQKHIRDIIGSQEDFEGDIPYLEDIEYKDLIFPDIDYKIYI